MAICLIIPLSFFISSNPLSTSLHSASITSSFVLYLFSCFTPGISRDFDGKNLSITQPINLSLPSMLPPMTFSFISIPADTLLQIASQYNFLPSLLMRRFLFVSFSQDLSGCTWIKCEDSYLSPRGYSCICPETNDRTFYVFYYNVMCR